MSSLNKYSKVVRQVLREIPYTRNSDEALYVHVINRLAREQGVSLISQLPLAQFFNVRQALSLPTIESIGRMRRKAQEEFADLRAISDVEAQRMLLEEEWRRFMGGRKDERH